MHRARRNGWGRNGALALACLAFALRALIATGYMLAAPAQAGSSPTIQICTGQGMVSLPVDAAGQPAKAPAKSNDDHPCPYAASAVALDAPTLSVAPAPKAAPVTSAETNAIADQRPGLGLAAPPPQPTGPPILV
jgi:hypothetical protein